MKLPKMYDELYHDILRWSNFMANYPKEFNKNSQKSIINFVKLIRSIIFQPLKSYEFINTLLNK